MATVSLSKGVFAFRNSKSNKSSLDPANKLGCFREASEDSLGKLRHHNFKSCWEIISSKVEKLLDESFCKVFDELVEFVRKKGCQPTSSQSKDVPTACLVTGVNMPDHESLYSALTHSIRSGVTNHIVRLAVCDCPNIKCVIHKIVLNFMEGEDVVSYEDSDEEEEQQLESTKTLKKASCNLPVLTAWYKDKYDAPCSPKKKHKNSKGSSSHNATKTPINDSRPPLVIIVENVEGMPKKVLEDLVCLCSMYRSCIPLILILGVSTTPSAVHSSLRQDASACIAMETFQSLPSTELLSKIVENILLEPNSPIRLGGKCFKLLMDTFLFHDLSVKNFINGLKFLTLEHFLSSPGGFLGCSAESRDQLIHSMPPSCLELLSKAASYRMYRDSLDDEKRAHLDDPEKFKEFVIDHLNILDKNYAAFCVLVRILHCLVCDLPRKPLGKKVREVMEVCLLSPVTKSKQFSEAMDFLQISGKDELLPKLKSALYICKEYKEPSLLPLTSKLACLMVNLNSAGTEVALAGQVVSPVRLNLKPTDRFNLREKIMEASRKNQPQSKSAYCLVREDILKLLKSWFRSHLRPPTEYLWHEVMTCDPPTSAFRFHLTGGLRAAVITGLSEPYKYLKCTCCLPSSTDVENVRSSDLSICYRLHLECGRNINLFDWMQAFVAVVDGVPEDGTAAYKKKRKETIDPKLQARFVQAASELQFLGMIKPTKRKTDHVQRLTWGGC